MSRPDSNALEAALVLVCVLTLLFIAVGLVGCVTKPVPIHSWGGSLSDYCGEHCEI